MSVQDKIERILKEIHVLFSQSQTYESDNTKIVVEKQQVFELLEQLNVAVYEVMDEYEVTSQKHELSERRSEKRGEEIIEKANRHADDIYAATIMYTDDALSRIQYIMEDANKSIQRVFKKMNTELGAERETVRQNQFELKEQLRDFADTEKYLKVIEELDAEREKERREKMEEVKEKRIQNEGKTYSAIQSDLSEITGKEFAETLRRRGAMGGVSQEAEKTPAAHTAPEVKVNTDSAYFKQKQTEGKKKSNLFRKY